MDPTQRQRQKYMATAAQQVLAESRPAIHHLQTRAGRNLLKRMVCLEMLAGVGTPDGEPVFPMGEVRVVVVCDFQLAEAAMVCGPEDDPHSAAESLANLAARCDLVLSCSDRKGQDVVLVERNA